MPDPSTLSTKHTAAALALLIAAAAVGALACGGGGPSDAQRTRTAVAAADAATATEVAAGPRPTADDVAGVIRHGFEGLKIDFRAVGIPTFRKQDVLLGVLHDCDTNRAGGASRESADFWPLVLGDCYTVGDALEWLYQNTGRQDFLYANFLMKRYNRGKFEEAVANGAQLDESYWDLVVDRIYALTPVSTPIFVTPLPATP